MTGETDLERDLGLEDADSPLSEETIEQFARDRLDTLRGDLNRVERAIDTLDDPDADPDPDPDPDPDSGSDSQNSFERDDWIGLVGLGFSITSMDAEETVDALVAIQEHTEHCEDS